MGIFSEVQISLRLLEGFPLVSLVDLIMYPFFQRYRLRIVILRWVPIFSLSHPILQSLTKTTTVNYR